MKKEDLEKLVAQMTLEEKASLCSGQDYWHTKTVDRLEIPAVMVSDGPHGLRTQNKEADHLGMNESIVAVCYPTGSALAASFDRELLEEMGQAIGESAQAVGVSTVLGPAVNIKRSPLCGRNFEYYSEDPYQAGEIATAFIKGVQSKNVGTSIKHFAANSQETRRLSSDSVVDERTLREIYYPAFEKAVKEVQPWTVMCSYNRINGEYASESKQLLTDVLRDEWGFKGLVVSDWGAVNERAKGISAGLDLEMPTSVGLNDAKIVEAVKEGTLSEEQLDTCVLRILDLVYKFVENRDPNAVFDRDKQHALSKKVAENAMVLLKNENILPLQKSQKIAAIGKYAKRPRYQGGGSSHINSYKVTGFLDMVQDEDQIIYAQGYHDVEDVIDEALVQEAIEAAKNADVAVIFAGLPDAFESEGYDRTHMRLPDCQNHLIEEITKVQSNVVIVLHNGSPVEMPWLSKVKGVLEAYLGGEAVGEAEYDILFGNVNPSGKLAETFPKRLEDNPSYLFYIGEEDEVQYREGIFVGYRYYDKKKMNVLFPFGYGLSYTQFQYGNLKLSKDTIKDTDCLEVSVDITNVGDITGKEVVQLYVKDIESTVIRPEKELKAFEKIELKAGETKTVTFSLDKRAFAYYNTTIKDFHVETGMYEILVGSSVADIHLHENVWVESTVKLPVRYTINTTFGDITRDPRGAALIEPLYQYSTMVESSTIAGDDEGERKAAQAMAEAMMNYQPLRSMITFQDGNVNYEMLYDILKKLNELD